MCTGACPANEALVALLWLACSDPVPANAAAALGLWQLGSCVLLALAVSLKPSHESDMVCELTTAVRTGACPANEALVALLWLARSDPVPANAAAALGL